MWRTSFHALDAVQKTDATRGVKITETPELLIFNLMRYYYDRKTKTETPELLIFNLMRYYYDWKTKTETPELLIFNLMRYCYDRETKTETPELLVFNLMQYYYDRKTKTETPELLVFNLMRYYYDRKTNEKKKSQVLLLDCICNYLNSLIIFHLLLISSVQCDQEWIACIAGSLGSR